LGCAMFAFDLLELDGLDRTPAHGLASSFFGFAARCVRPERRSNGLLRGGNAAAAFITVAPNSGPYARGGPAFPRANMGCSGLT
jgi:hypothetical protein